METLGRALMLGGLLLFLVGGLIFLSARLGLPLGHFPGDLRFERGGVRIYFPLASGLLISLVLTLIFNLVIRLWKK